jgi:glycolate oxidase iron-sulfur subunit
MPLLYPHVHAATVRVLTRNGFEVVVPAAQTCCGALHLHAGERALARELAARVVAAFADQEVDAVIVNAAGCGAALKEYGELFAGGDGAAPAVGQFAGRVRDVTEFLAGVSLAPMPRAVRRRVALQESCHLVHAQRVKDAPRQLLRQVPGLELVELEQPDRCCGSAGIYNVVQPELSLQLLDERMAEVRASGADTIVTANPGCMLQLEAGLRRHHLSGAVKHVVEVLDEAYGRPEVGS